MKPPDDGRARYEPPTPAALARRLANADRPGEHLWIVTAAWHVPDPAAIWNPAALTLLDQENLIAMPAPGCYKCEKPYSAKMAKRRCLGSTDVIQQGSRE